MNYSWAMSVLFLALIFKSYVESGAQSQVANIVDSLMDAQNLISVRPPYFAGLASTSFQSEKMLNNSTPRRWSYVSTRTRDLWDRLFDEAYKADVCISTRNGGIL